MNETTLDIRPVFKAVEKIAGRGCAPMWFDRMIQMSMVHTHTGQYDGFGALAKSALEVVCASKGALAGEAEWVAVRSEIGAMKGYPDVAPGLQTMSANGYRVVAFTNSTLATVTSQLEGAGMTALYDDVLSVDGPRCYKPALKTYQYALQQMSCAPENAIMVACHDWDLAGAAAVGMKTAFIRRENCYMASAFPPPDYDADNFVDLADQLGKPD